MKIKTAELTGAALDWAVGMAIGEYTPVAVPAYSTDWALGGVIIEREEISMAKVGRSVDDVIAPHPEGWAAHIDGAHTCYGTAPLIAAMRCYVASKLGDEIEIPEEITL